MTEAKLRKAFAISLDGKAVFITQNKQWMIWDGSIWSSDDCGLMVKLALHFNNEAKQALFDTGNHSAAGNLSSIERLSRLDNLCKLAATDQAVSLADFDKDLIFLAAPNQWIDLQSGLPHDPDPSVLICKAIATDYCAKSLCPSLEAFLKEIFESDQILI